uniref:EF-hand domain-containing protein n=1 Tax=Eutreptiella gymnastica TaxID=73025 RepID=A0A7S1I4Q0_9EUGL
MVQFDMDALQKELGLSQLEIENYKEAFDHFDADGGGTVTVDELEKALKLTGCGEGLDAKAMLAEVDHDDSGCVDFREFCQLMIRSQQQRVKDPMQEMREGFQAFDKDGSGTVSMQEIRHVLTHLGEHLDEEHWEVMEQMVRELDGDGDGEITYDEFLRLIAVE